MRIAIISDIHGNCFALDAVLADMDGGQIDGMVCLGDAVQGGAQPAETVARLRELRCPVVMGNADAWLLSGVNTSAAEWVTEPQEAARQWALAQLSETDIAFIEDFQATVTVPLDGGRTLLCFHGSPHSFEDFIFPETPEEEFQSMLGPYQPAIMAGGHTHLQQIRRLGDAFFFNPGSVGLAYNRNQPDEGFQLDPWAEYAVLTSDEHRLRVEFRRVALDVARLIEIIAASSRPYADDSIARYDSQRHSPGAP